MTTTPALEGVIKEQLPPIRPEPGESFETFARRANESLIASGSTNEVHRRTAINTMWQETQRLQTSGTPICGICGNNSFNKQTLMMACGHDPAKMEYARQFSELLRDVMGKSVDFQPAPAPAESAQAEPSSEPSVWCNKFTKRKDEDAFTYVFGPVLVPEKADHHSDIISAEDIEVAAHDFMQDSLRPNLLHKRLVSKHDVVFVESFVSKDRMKVAGRRYPTGTWFLGARVYNPELRRLIKEGKLNGWSIEGRAARLDEPN